MWSESQPIAGVARNPASRKDVVIRPISVLDAPICRPYRARSGMTSPSPKKDTPTVMISTSTGNVYIVVRLSLDSVGASSLFVIHLNQLASQSIHPSYPPL